MSRMSVRTTEACGWCCADRGPAKKRKAQPEAFPTAGHPQTCPVRAWRALSSGLARVCRQDAALEEPEADVGDQVDALKSG
jgi:hypothetical protein